MQLFRRLSLSGLFLLAGALVRASTLIYPVEAIDDLWQLPAEEFRQRYAGINVTGIGPADEGWYVRYRHENLTCLFGPLVDMELARKKKWEMEAVRDAAIRNRATLSSSKVDYVKFTFSGVYGRAGNTPYDGKGGAGDGDGAGKDGKEGTGSGGDKNADGAGAKLAGMGEGDGAGQSGKSGRQNGQFGQNGTGEGGEAASGEGGQKGGTQKVASAKGSKAGGQGGQSGQQGGQPGQPGGQAGQSGQAGSSSSNSSGTSGQPGSPGGPPSGGQGGGGNPLQVIGAILRAILGL